MIARHIPDILANVAKVLISVDDTLLRRIDRMAKLTGLSRSAYIARIAKQDAGSTSGRAAASNKRALERLDRLFAKAPSVESSEEMRAERDAR